MMQLKFPGEHYFSWRVKWPRRWMVFVHYLVAGEKQWIQCIDPADTFLIWERTSLIQASGGIEKSWNEKRGEGPEGEDKEATNIQKEQDVWLYFKLVPLERNLWLWILLYNSKGFQSNEKTLTFWFGSNTYCAGPPGPSVCPRAPPEQGDQTMDEGPLPINNNQLTVCVQAEEWEPEEADALRGQSLTQLVK